MRKLFKQYAGLRKEIYVIFACKLIDNMGSMVGPLLTLILSSKLNMSATDIALWMAIYSIVGAPVLLVGGKLADKANKKLLINICDVITSAIYILCGFIPFSKWTIVIYLFGCLLQKAEHPAYNSLIADFTTTDDRERANSLGYLGANLGLILAPILGSYLIKDYLELLFIITGATQLISIIVFDIFVKQTIVIIDDSNKYENISDSTSLITIFKENKVVFSFILVFAFTMFVYDQFGYLMPLTLDLYHGEAGTIYYGVVSSINCVVVLVFTAIITNLISRLTSLSKIMLGAFFEILGYIIFLVFIVSPYASYFSAIIFTFGEIISTISTEPFINKRIPANYRGRVGSFVWVVELIIQSLGKIIVGKVFDNYGYQLAWTIVIIVSLLTIVILQLLKKADKKDYPTLYQQNRA